MSKKSSNFAALFVKLDRIHTMSDDQLQQLIQTTLAKAAQDEAMAEVLRAGAYQARQLVAVIQDKQQEIDQLKQERHINIENFNGNYIETAKIESLCQPSSPTSTERTSSMLNSSFNTTEQQSQTPPENKDK